MIDFSGFTRTQVAAHTYIKLVVQIVYNETFYMYTHRICSCISTHLLQNYNILIYFPYQSRNSPYKILPRWSRHQGMNTSNSG